MIPILLSIRNSKWISFPSSKPLSDRTGSSFLNTISGSMANLLSRFNAAMAKLFPKISSVPYAVPLTITSMTTMVETASISARSVGRLSALVNSFQHHSGLSAPTAEILLLPRKTENFSAYINVLTQSVLTISTAFPKSIPKT